MSRWGMALELVMLISCLLLSSAAIYYGFKCDYLAGIYCLMVVITGKIVSDTRNYG